MNGTIITKKGVHLLTKLVAAETPLIFTRAAVGTGKLLQNYDPSMMLDLIEYKMDGTISSCNASGDEASIVFQISSDGIETGFSISEAGLYAEDPDEGEILYAYVDMSSDTQYIYAQNEEISKFVEITLTVIIGATKNITAYISPSSMITKEIFDETVAKLETPDFNDSGEVEGIGSFSDFLESFVKGTSIYQFFANFKAGLKFVLHAGQLVNNGMCETPGMFPMDAAYGKTLTDQITQLYSDLGGFNPIVDETTGKITGYKTTIGGADTVFPFSEIDKNALLEALSASGLNITADSTPEEIYDKLSAAIFIPQGQIWPDSLANEYSWSVSFSFGGERWGWSSNYGDTYTQTVTFTLKKDGSLYSRSSISYSGDNFYTNYISSYSKAIESLPSVLKSYPLKGSFSKGLSVSGYKSSGSGTLSINFANKLCTISESFYSSRSDGDRPTISSWNTSFVWPQTYMGRVTLST